VLKDTTSRGLCVRVGPPHTSEWRMYVYDCRTYEKAVSGGGPMKKLCQPECATEQGGREGKRRTPSPVHPLECLLLEDLVQSCVRGKGGK